MQVLEFKGPKTWSSDIQGEEKMGGEEGEREEENREKENVPFFLNFVLSL